MPPDCLRSLANGAGPLLLEESSEHKHLHWQVGRAHNGQTACRLRGPEATKSELKDCSAMCPGLLPHLRAICLESTASGMRPDR